MPRSICLPTKAIKAPPRLVAITLWGANGHNLRCHANEEDFDLVREAGAAIDLVEQLFGHYLVN